MCAQDPSTLQTPPSSSPPSTLATFHFTQQASSQPLVSSPPKVNRPRRKEKRHARSRKNERTAPFPPKPTPPTDILSHLHIAERIHISPICNPPRSNPNPSHQPSHLISSPSPPPPNPNSTLTPPASTPPIHQVQSHLANPLATSHDSPF